FDRAAAYFEQAYAVFKAINNRRGMGFTINNLGGIHSVRGNYDEAHRMFAEGYALHKEIGDRSGTAHSLSALANVAFFTGDVAGAEKNYQEALAIRRNLGDQKGISDSLTDLADVAFAREDVLGARQLYEQSLEVSRAIGDQSGIARAMIWIGITIGIADQDEAACRPYFEEGLALAEKVGNGAVMVMAYLGLGEVTFHTGKYAEARDYFRKALYLANYGKAVGMMLFSLIGFASVMVAEGNPIRSLEIAGLVQRYPRTAINFMTDMKLKYLLDEVCPKLADDVVLAALERGRELDLDETVNALLAESAA
ncbi:MAG: tetratricopeptide repeat protein, partial [Chitinophagaceae bacterium]|nr:tetratricopeptide repeat protein [Anaerolineae bacterium]